MGNSNGQLWDVCQKQATGDVWLSKDPKMYGLFLSDQHTLNLIRVADIETLCDEMETLAGSECRDEDKLSTSLRVVLM